MLNQTFLLEIEYYKLLDHIFGHFFHFAFIFFYILNYNFNL
jgi:hypothetical protein